MRRAGLALCAAACAALTGAGGGGCKADREVPVEVLRAGPSCGGAGEGFSARRIASADELRAAVPPATTLGGAADPPAPAAPDLDRDAVLLVSMGQRPTGGYAIELARPVALVKGDVAGVQLTLRSPAPGAMAVQMVTSPCLVVKLPGAGLREVRVVDAERKELARVRL